MTDILYPVPQGPPSVLGPSRILRVLAADPILTTRDVLRGRGGAQRGTVPDPTARRHSFFFGLPQAVAAPPLISTIVLRGRVPLEVITPRRSFMFGLPQVVAAPSTGIGPLIGHNRLFGGLIGHDRLAGG